MINLSNLNEVRALQVNMRTTFDTPHGKEVIKFLEQACGWYDFSEVEPNRIQIAHGKRQILATIKTLLELPPEAIVQLVTQ